MTEIQNSKPLYDFEVFKGPFIDTDKTEMTAVRIANVLVIEYCDLRFTLRLAQGGELVEPFVIWCLLFGIYTVWCL
jgi:hypothetical protein